MCGCEKCKKYRRCEANLERARKAIVTVICPECGNPADMKVGRVQAMHGAATCQACMKRARRG